MEFKVSKSKLNTCLNMVRTAISVKTTNPILKTILLNVENNKVTFRGTNTILDISVTIPAEVKKEGICCFDSVISDIVQNFSDDYIKFKLDDKLVISQGRRRHSPLYASPEDYPAKHECKDYTEYNPEELLAALSRTSICTSTLEDRPVLQGFYINPHDKFIVTSDGHRATVWEDIELPGNVTIPQAKIVMSILSYLIALGETDRFELSLGQWIGFKGIVLRDDEEVMNWEIIFSSLAGDFPELARKVVTDALSANPKLKVLSSKSDLKNILDICKIYSDRAYNEGRSNQVILSHNGQGIVFSMQIPDLIEMEEHLEAKIEGDNFQIWLNPGMLLEAVGQVQSDEVELRFFEPDAPFILLDHDVPQFTYLQVPMTPNKY